MNIVQINTCNYGSTGNIMLQISELAKENGHDVRVVYANTKDNLLKPIDNSILIGNKLSFWFSHRLNYHTGFNGCGVILPTLALLKKIKKFNPDLIQLHNLHNCYINLPLLFRFIKKHNIPVVWTLHDCWSFTGQCAHFDYINCQKWQSGCHTCSQTQIYPSSKVDRTTQMWKLKKAWFSCIPDMTLVTPSKWLSDLVSHSSLNEYPVKVINNGIDLTVFKRKDNDFRKKHSIAESKKIVLGVSFGWGEKKGLDVFIELSKRLNNEKYQIVLVGTDDTVDKLLPGNIISIHKTNNQQELVEIYSTADVFVNPTREEVLGLVNIEANACGIPVVTFRSGGSPECISKKSGSIVEQNNIDAMEKEIIRICETQPYNIADCINQAKNFDKAEKFNEYLNLYNLIHQKSKKIK